MEFSNQKISHNSAAILSNFLKYIVYISDILYNFISSFIQHLSCALRSKGHKNALKHMQD